MASVTSKGVNESV